jgi:hypothetical protein
MNDMSEPWREYQRLEARITRSGLYLSRVQYLPFDLHQYSLKSSLVDCGSAKPLEPEHL